MKNIKNWKTFEEKAPELNTPNNREVLKKQFKMYWDMGIYAYKYHAMGGIKSNVDKDLLDMDFKDLFKNNKYKLNLENIEDPEYEFKRFWDMGIYSYTFHKKKLSEDKIKKWVNIDFKDFFKEWCEKNCNEL